MSIDIKDAENAVVIYHANCNDGFASAWAFSLLKAEDYEEVSYRPASYGEHPGTDYFDRDVYILDFSFPRAELELISGGANKVILIDHHKTAQDTLQWPEYPISGISRPPNLEINFDMSKAGCLLTWEYFAPNDKVPKLIQYIADRDVWAFNLPDSKAINAVVALTPHAFISYLTLSYELDYEYTKVLAKGEALLAQHEKICGELATLAREIQLKDCDGKVHSGFAVNCNYQFASEVGNLLALKSNTFGATYFTGADGNIKFSIRSNGDYDVSAIAKNFGGGGHKNASGFTLVPEGSSEGIAIWKLGE